MGRIGETLLAGSLLLAGAGAIGTAEYLHHESGVGQDARADACVMGLDQQGQIDCFEALAQTQGAEQATLYIAGTALILGGIYGVARTRERYPRSQEPSTLDKHPVV